MKNKTPCISHLGEIKIANFFQACQEEEKDKRFSEKKHE